MCVSVYLYVGEGLRTEGEQIKVKRFKHQFIMMLEVCKTSYVVAECYYTLFI